MEHTPKPLRGKWQILSVPQLRKIYDEGGVEGLAMPSWLGLCVWLQIGIPHEGSLSNTDVSEDEKVVLEPRLQNSRILTIIISGHGASYQSTPHSTRFTRNCTFGNCSYAPLL